jgi:RNA polymerase-binding transcription factor DksA
MPENDFAQPAKGAPAWFLMKVALYLILRNGAKPPCFHNRLRLLSLRSVSSSSMLTKRAQKPSRSRPKPRATTTDVLDPLPKSEKIPTRFRKYYNRLIDLRNALLNQRTDLARDGKEKLSTFSTHMADAGTDEYDRDFALSMLSSEQNAIYEIEEVLQRIRDGTYDICELTGKPIERARLEAIPWTRFTSEAEKQLEQDGSVKKVRFAPPDRIPKVQPKPDDEEEE